MQVLNNDAMIICCSVITSLYLFLYTEFQDNWLQNNFNDLTKLK